MLTPKILLSGSSHTIEDITGIVPALSWPGVGYLAPAFGIGIGDSVHLASRAIL